MRQLARAAALAAALWGGSAAMAAAAEAYVAGGCFWCVEADFEKVEGVGDVVSGYSGGDLPNPTYRQVSAGNTGHLEAAMIPYDPQVISYAELMELFFRSVDPTDGGGQFCDRGPHYATAIFVRSEAERVAAEMAKAEAEKALGRKIETPVLRFSSFYPAEEYHQDYYKKDERLPVSSVGIGVPKKVAYERYREGCGRDRRLTELWGEAAWTAH